MMALGRSRPAFRRFALALAACQLLAYGSAPFIEAMTERTPGVTHIEAAHTAACVILHSANSCMACQLLTTHAQQARAAGVPVLAVAVAGPSPATHLLAPSRAPPSNRQCRAPPINLA
jgi:hypothetical protein